MRNAELFESRTICIDRGRVCTRKHLKMLGKTSKIKERIVVDISAVYYSKNAPFLEEFMGLVIPHIYVKQIY
jgi:hypothetical protein